MIARLLSARRPRSFSPPPPSPTPACPTSVKGMKAVVLPDGLEYRRPPQGHRRRGQGRQEGQGPLHRLARRLEEEVRQLGRSPRADRVQPRQRHGHQGLGRGHRGHEGRRPPPAAHPGQARLRRARRRRAPFRPTPISSSTARSSTSSSATPVSDRASSSPSRRRSGARSRRCARSAPSASPCAAALGRVLAEDVAAPGDVPPHDNSAMDGYAVRTADAVDGAELRVIGEVAAGQRGDARARRRRGLSHHDRRADPARRRRRGHGQEHTRARRRARCACAAASSCATTCAIAARTCAPARWCCAAASTLRAGRARHAGLGAARAGRA